MQIPNLEAVEEATGKVRVEETRTSSISSDKTALIKEDAVVEKT